LKLNLTYKILFRAKKPPFQKSNLDDNVGAPAHFR